MHDPEREPVAVLERLDHSRHRENRIRHRQMPESLICIGEKKRFNETRPIGERDELH